MPNTGSPPEVSNIVLELKDENIRIDTWKSYHFNSHFLTPTDGWRFTLGDEEIKVDLLNNLIPGNRVQLRINDLIQGDGYIDSVEISSDRHGGTEFTVTGRDKLSPAVDGCVDPLLRFAAGKTLDDLIQAVFAPFGFTKFQVDNDLNKNLATGSQRAIPTTKKGKPLRSYVLHQFKPYPSEGAFAFASRVSQRFGLWIWCSVDGETLIVSKPTFDESPARFSIRHKTGAAGAQNNVISSRVARDGTDQPSLIIATSEAGGAEHPHIGNTAIVVNRAITTDTAAVLKRYPQARIVTTPGTWVGYPNRFARPLFLHDDESKTPDQLERFCKRELALRMRKSFTATYEVEGHENSGQPWCVDATVDVDDDISQVHETLWVLSRTFTKDRHGGTRTQIECIRPFSLEF